MKPNVDLTENSDFTDRSLFYGISRVRIFPHWTDKCLLRPDKILRECGVRTFSYPTEFPPSDRCECCGRLKPPWRDLCKECDGNICTPEEVKTKGLPRNPEMISNLRDLRI